MIGFPSFTIVPSYDQYKLQVMLLACWRDFRDFKDFRDFRDFKDFRDFRDFKDFKDFQDLRISRISRISGISKISRISRISWLISHHFWNPKWGVFRVLGLGFRVWGLAPELKTCHFGQFWQFSGFSPKMRFPQTLNPEMWISHHFWNPKWGMFRV